MITRENTGKIMVDALQVRRAELVKLLASIEDQLSSLDQLTIDRDQLLVDIQSIDDEINGIANSKNITVVLEAVPL